MRNTADAVVIGAGVVGTGVALGLARSGRSVAVVERNPGPGQGSTSASSAIVRFNYSRYDGVATSWEAKFGWEDWAGHLGRTSDDGLARYHRTGGWSRAVLTAPPAGCMPRDIGHCPSRRART